jgi:NAD(P)-dependent dehydrogenase (short-subunit alcohol dehydrogenase family)
MNITPDAHLGLGVALITGCSTGIGRATAAMLASAGYQVVATARRPATLDGLDAAMAMPLDVTDASSIEAVVEAVRERYGRIDVLVNNAGYALRGAVEEVDVEAVRGMFDTNVLGIIRMLHAVAPIMRRQGSGRIVNVGSLAGKFGGPANGTYAATKHAVEALSDAMRWELAPFGIRVILIEPGAIRTEFEKTVERNSGGVIACPESPYAALYERVVRANERIRASQPGPEAVASVILTAVRAEHPHARYPAAIPFPARLTMALPDTAKDLVIRRLYGSGSLPRVTGQARLSTRSDNGAVDTAEAGGGLTVFARGGGPALLLMPYPHAVSVVGDPTMDLLIDRLASVGRRVVTFDPPGSGRSTRPERIRRMVLANTSSGVRRSCERLEPSIDLVVGIRQLAALIGRHVGLLHLSPC